MKIPIIFLLLLFSLFGFSSSVSAETRWSAASICGGLYEATTIDDPQGPIRYAQYKADCPSDPSEFQACAASSDRFCYFKVTADSPGDWTGYRWRWQYSGAVFFNRVGCPAGMTQNELTRICEAPSCDPPNYIHPETNECTQPEEVCFTTIESMADRCVFIGETTPEAPPGCIRDEETQAEICLSENEGCYVADGKEICPTPGMVCGVKNGTFSCVAPEQEGCGYFNGERVCFTPDGQKVDPDSPDHPDNGGNLDGDDTNDPTDPRTPEEGGNPDNQPIDTTGQGDGATEGTAREQLKALRQLRDDVRNQNKANEGNGSALEQGISSGIGSAGDSATGQLDDHIDGIDTTAPMEADDLSGIESTVSNLFGVSTQCTDIVFGTQELFYTITCQQMDKVRDLLGFLLYGFTVIRLFQIAVRPAAKGTP